MPALKADKAWLVIGLAIWCIGLIALASSGLVALVLSLGDRSKDPVLTWKTLCYRRAFYRSSRHSAFPLSSAYPKHGCLPTLGCLETTLSLGMLAGLKSQNAPVELEQGAQMTFDEFRGRCLQACKKHADPEAQCAGAPISRYWVDYVASCDKNKYNCHLPAVSTRSP